MGWGGMALYMKQVTAANKALLAKRKSFKDIRETYRLGVNQPGIEIQEVSEEVLTEIRIRIKADQRKEDIKKILVISGIMIVMLLILFGLLL